MYSMIVWVGSVVIYLNLRPVDSSVHEMGSKVDALVRRLG